MEPRGPYACFADVPPIMVHRKTLGGNVSVLVVNTVEDAIEIIAASIDEEDFDYTAIEFGPEFGLKFRVLDESHSEIPAQFIDSYYREYQQIFRIIALIENGNADIKSLTSEQLEKYDFRVKVTDGSSGLEGNLPDLLTKLATEALGKMNGVEAVVTILGLAAIAACGWGFRSFLQHRRDSRIAEISSHERLRTIEAFNAASAESAAAYIKMIETMRATGDIPKRAADAAETIQSSRLRALAQTSQTEVDNILVLRDEARELRSGPRRKSVSSTITKEMKVIDVNTSDPANTTIILEDLASGDQSKVTFRDRVIGDLKIGIVHKALQMRGSATFTLKIKEIEDEVVSTEILDVVAADRSGAA